MIAGDYEKRRGPLAATPWETLRWGRKFRTRGPFPIAGFSQCQWSAPHYAGRAPMQATESTFNGASDLEVSGDGPLLARQRRDCPSFRATWPHDCDGSPA